MATDRFLIAPLETGLVSSLKPWQIPDDSFSLLENAYCWRGTIRKRFGSTFMGTGGTALTAPLLSRFRVQVGTLAAPLAFPGHIIKVGMQFSAGNVIFTVYNHAAGANQMYRTDGTAEAATFNLGTGVFNIVVGALPGATPIYFYPLEPVMGLTTYKSGAINNQPSYGFDTQFA